MNTKAPFSLIMLLVILSSLILSGCGKVAGVEATAVPPTSTPKPADTATATLPPTATETSVPTSTPTKVPTATPNMKATLKAKTTQAAEELNAKVAPDLEKYGVDPSAGHIVWASNKLIELEVTSYAEYDNYVLKDAGVLEDFVIQSDIKWNTSGALSLCGINFHAQGGQDDGKRNRFMMMRLQFAPGWTIWRDNYNQFDYHLTGEWASSGDILDKNNDTNIVALVVQGINIDVYINGKKQRRVEDLQLADGTLALSTFQESGKTNCKFSNTWVWEFDK